MLDIEKIRELVEMMVANDLVEISLRDGEEEVNLRRPGGTAGEVLVNPDSGVSSAAALSAPARGLLPGPTEESPLAEIVSPMVGTFYSAVDPESEPLVRVGAQVQPGMVVCILEAMKVFNEIKSEVAGTIERILAKNAQAVEYGQPLFLVRPL